MSAATNYLRGLYQRFAYYGSWLPNVAVRLGDVGVLDGPSFKRLTTLKDLGIPFAVREGAAPVDFTYTSQSAVKLSTKAKGEVAAGTALPIAEAGVAVELSSEGAFLFQAMGCNVSEVENKLQLGQALIKLLEQKRWEMEWTVIDTVVAADCATIVVSNSNSSSLELTARTPLDGTNLARADAGITVSAQKGDIIRFIAARSLTPLFKISRLRVDFLAGLFGKQPITFGGGNQDRKPPQGPALEPVPFEISEK